MQKAVELIDNSYISVILEDPLDFETADSIAKQVDLLATQLRNNQKAVRILCEIKGSSMVDQATRNRIASATKSIQYDKIAAFGSKTLMRNIANLTLMAVGKYEQTRLFDTEQEARLWLGLS